MTVFRAAFPALPVADVTAAATFYVDRLGFRVVHQESAVAIVMRDEVAIHLWGATDRDWLDAARPTGENPVKSGAESFLAGTGSCRIEVREIEPFYETCRTAGVVHPNGPLGRRPWGATEFSILDPDGNCVTFTEPPAAG